MQQTRGLFKIVRARRLALAGIALVAAAAVLAGALWGRGVAAGTEETDFIKWVEFNVPYEALDHALELDIAAHETDMPLDWVTLLAVAAAQNYGNFDGFKVKQLDTIAERLKDGEPLEEITQGLKYYDYYQEAYDAVLGGLVGTYEIEVADEASPEGKRWETRYGLMGFSPIAQGYYYNDYDDFGASRSYGFKRTHLGHDMMGSVGTPIIAVESGVVEALGWNQYGGWRIGIRSLDSKRYYYYAHLRKNFPYNKSLQVGSVVQAGDVIGYLGRTGYSTKENVNNINVSHLHFGLQLVFDESQKEALSEIWIDVYPLTRLLYRNRSTVVKDEETKEYSRVYQIRIPGVPVGQIVEVPTSG